MERPMSRVGVRGRLVRSPRDVGLPDPRDDFDLPTRQCGDVISTAVPRTRNPYVAAIYEGFR